MIPHPFLDSSRRLRNGWWIAIFFLILAALLLPLLLASRAGEAELPIWKQALIVLGASLIGQRLRRRPIAELTGALNSRWPLEWLLGGSIGAALMLAPALLLGAFGLITWDVSALGVAALAPTLGLSLAVAATEELLFRGFMFQRLLDGLGYGAAQLIVAAFFVLTHSTTLQNAGALAYLGGVNIFIASLMFGLAFVRTGSLALPMGIHFGANFVQGGVLGFGVSGGADAGLLTPRFATGADWLTGGAFGLEASLPGLICVILTTRALAARLRGPAQEFRGAGRTA